MKKATAFRRELRQNQTDAEKLLWSQLRNRQLDGIKFKRQQSVEPYICDFYCAEARIGIELDGGGHYESGKKERDAARTLWINAHGVTILRFSNAEVLCELEGVLERILFAVRSAPHPGPLPSGEREFLR